MLTLLLHSLGHAAGHDRQHAMTTHPYFKSDTIHPEIPKPSSGHPSAGQRAAVPWGLAKGSPPDALGAERPSAAAVHQTSAWHRRLSHLAGLGFAA